MSSTIYAGMVGARLLSEQCLEILSTETWRYDLRHPLIAEDFRILCAIAGKIIRDFEGEPRESNVYCEYCLKFHCILSVDVRTL